MKSNRIVILVCGSILAVGIVYSGLQGQASHDAAAKIERQHQDLHEQNEERRRREAWAEHLKRVAYDRAHPEILAARKAAAAETTRRQQAAREAKAQAERLARAAEAKKDAAANELAAAQNAARAAQEDKEAHPCDTADRLERQAADASGHQKQYDLSVSGLHYVDLCDNENDNILNKGYLLSIKAMAEHYLSSGDSNTDMNQATTLLAECQTLPGVYGTHAGAQCESQEEDDISTKQSWDMAKYSADN